MARLTLFTDGACSGNPGPAGIGYVILGQDGAELQSQGESIGRATNNIAEYTALIRGLRACAALGAEAVEVVSDSELLVRQMTGVYRVKHPGLKPLWDEAQAAARAIGKVTYRHVLRHENARADGLASAAVRAG